MAKHVLVLYILWYNIEEETLKGSGLMSFRIYGYLFIAVGLFTIWGALAKPAFFWSSRKAERTRKLLGEGGTMLLYLILGGALSLVGILSVLGIINLVG